MEVTAVQPIIAEITKELQFRAGLGLGKTSEKKAFLHSAESAYPESGVTGEQSLWGGHEC